MKHLTIISMAWITAMVSTSVSAQSTVPDLRSDQISQPPISKVKYQAEDEFQDKSFGPFNYYVNITAAGSTLTESAGDYTYGNSGCIYENNLSGTYDVNLHLPDGHKIIGHRYFFEDGSAGSTYSFLMAMKGNGLYTQLNSVQSTGSSGAFSSEYTALPTQHIVNNAENFYVMRFNSGNTGSDQKMCGARIYMDPTP